MWLLLAAIAPAALLLYYVYSKDFNPEPKKLVFKAFGYGALSAFVSSFISVPLMQMGLFASEPETFADAVRLSFLGAAVPEESAKLIMLWIFLRHCKEFDERYDGLVYAAAVGLGFAFLENIMYVLSAGEGWMVVSISRALFAVPGHFAFAIVMGYFYSKNHFSWTETSGWDRFKVWLYPVLLHGVYDTLAFTSDIIPAWSGLITLGLIAFCIWLFRQTRKRILAEAEENKRLSMESTVESVFGTGDEAFGDVVAGDDEPQSGNQ